MSSKNTHRGTRRPIPVLGRLLRTRTRKITAGVLALMMVGGVAWAAYVTLAGVSGTVTSADLVAQWVPSSTVTVTPSAGIVGNCGTATVDSSGVMHLSITGVLPGDACTYSAPVTLAPGANTVGTIQGVALPDLPAHFGVTTVTPCGSGVGTANLDGRNGGAALTPQTVTFTITAGPSIAQGVTGTLTATSDGVTVVPATQAVTGCVDSPTAS